MAAKVKPQEKDATELLRDILIVQLGLAGVPQRSIRAIIGCDIVRVNRIVRYLKASKGRGPNADN